MPKIKVPATTAARVDGATVAAALGAEPLPNPGSPEAASQTPKCDAAIRPDGAKSTVRVRSQHGTDQYNNAGNAMISDQNYHYKGDLA